MSMTSAATRQTGNRTIRQEDSERQLSISVIIPAYQEETVIGTTLENLITRHRPEEVIVVDGGSTDRTVRIAGRFTQVVRSEKGRAKQMNQGARLAHGRILLFLHADTILPENGLQMIRETVTRGRFSAGRFRMQFDRNHFLLRFYSLYTRFHFFSYGDQGFFITRQLFDELMGFNETVPFEDIDFYRRLFRKTKPVIVKAPVMTSARRFDQVGLLRQKFVNLFLVGLYYAGIDIFALKAKMYRDVRER